MNDMVDMARFTEAKSDQLNADDLIGISKTITVTKVTGQDGDQPISIFYQGDNGKPFKPCKTIRRVLMGVWGRYANDYVGRSMTLYRDDNVMFGGLEVGGIRISHMTHIEKETIVVVNKSKGKKVGLKVLPLRVDSETGKPGADPGRIKDAINAFAGIGVDLARLEAKGGPSANWSQQDLNGLEGLFIAIRDGKKAATEVFPVIERQSGFGQADQTVDEGRADGQHGDQHSDNPIDDWKRRLAKAEVIADVLNVEAEFKAAGQMSDDDETEIAVQINEAKARFQQGGAH